MRSILESVFETCEKVLRRLSVGFVLWEGRTHSSTVRTLLQPIKSPMGVRSVLAQEKSVQGLRLVNLKGNCLILWNRNFSGSKWLDYNHFAAREIRTHRTKCFKMRFQCNLKKILIKSFNFIITHSVIYLYQNHWCNLNEYQWKSGKSMNIDCLLDVMLRWRRY